jgi:hypothetical protein
MTEKEKHEEIQYRLDCIRDLERMCSCIGNTETICRLIDEHAIEIMRLSN